LNKNFFVADIHLNPREPKKKELFINFLDFVKSKKGDLYILGDCFDYWANNSRVISENQIILEKFLELTKEKISIKMLFGNRDFLLKSTILKRFGVDFFGEEVKINIGDKSLFLTHGHNLCKWDYKFQNYKRRIWPLFRLLDRILPGKFAAFLAEIFILKSKEVILAQDEKNFIFAEDIIFSYLNQNIDFIICGHSHRSLIKEILPGKYFIILPAWEERSGGYLLMEDESFKIIDFK
jgi:UDP-2,3-diacylglucosamine hydrolase